LKFRKKGIGFYTWKIATIESFIFLVVGSLLRLEAFGEFDQ